MLGDVLQARIEELSSSSTRINDDNAFWKVLREIARNEIMDLFPSKVDSDIIVPIYYEILSKNSRFIPEYFKVVLKSNNQERFRVINRNLFTSNAFHPDGLANQPGIKAYKSINEFKKGCRIVYQGEYKYVNKR